MLSVELFLVFLIVLLLGTLYYVIWDNARKKFVMIVKEIKECSVINAQFMADTIDMFEHKKSIEDLKSTYREYKEAQKRLNDL